MKNFRTLIKLARGREKADIVFKNGRVVNVFTGEIHPAAFAVNLPGRPESC